MGQIRGCSDVQGTLEENSGSTMELYPEGGVSDVLVDGSHTCVVILGSIVDTICVWGRFEEA